MPVKILLADKSITIQKVVEMLFSGKEYEVTCVSDGESALGEAARIVPDVVLADVDLPRIDGYGFAARMKQTAALSQTPVVLMMSRDDQFDPARSAGSGIVDHIAKPFESQELIGKVKKALSTAVSRPAVAAPTPQRPAAAVSVQTPPKPAPSPVPPPRPVEAAPAAQPSRPKAAVPSDIFGIIAEAPAQAESAPPPAPPAKAAREELFEVEPEIEVEPEAEEPAAPAPPPAAETRRRPAAPPAAEAFDAEKLFGKEPASPPPAPSFLSSADMEVEAEIVPEEPSATAGFAATPPMPPEVEKALPVGQKAVDEMRAGLGLGERPQVGEAYKETPMQNDFVSFESLDMASRVSHEDYSYATPATEEPRRVAPPPSETPLPARSFAQPAASEDMVRAMSQELVAKIAREVLERVAWEVIPDLAERLIREEIERLKAGS